jgi:hypothetical protein
VAGTQACHQHKAGRPGKNIPWQPTTERVSQPHDEPAPDIEMSKNYFSAKRFYSVETLCAPCDVIVAWTKFDKSESPTKILNFWSLFIQLRNQDRTIYALIKLV